MEVFCNDANKGTRRKHTLEIPGIGSALIANMREVQVILGMGGHGKHEAHTKKKTIFFSRKIYLYFL